MSDALLLLAEAIAREAGVLLREGFVGASRPGLETATKSTPTDLVSELDLAAERLIRRRLAEARPDDAILGEEGGDAPGTSGLRWIVDPLDGTVNFLFGIPQFGVSIACEDERGTLVGVVYDPVRHELWAAERDGAATLDGAELRAPARSDAVTGPASGGHEATASPSVAASGTPLGTAMVATGFGYDAGVREVQGRTVARLLPHVRDIRRIGSAALDLAWTAAGRFDAYYERGINVWDIAAGVLICERAGLAVRRLEPDPPAREGIVVASPALIDELEALLRVEP